MAGGLRAMIFSWGVRGAMRIESVGEPKRVGSK